MAQAIPQTMNEAWGFFGTITRDAEPNQAWALAMQMICQETGCSITAVRDFLDSRDGRHFADDVANGLDAGRDLPAAIGLAVARWNGWRISRQTARETGIPCGLPYLTAMVTHYEILAEAAAD
jgi:hypothetical protein